MCVDGTNGADVSFYLLDDSSNLIGEVHKKQ